MTRLNAIAEQLAGVEHRAVAAVCTAAAVPACARWRELELHLADAAAEAKETAKYLTTLEGSLGCIYTSASLLLLGRGVVGSGELLNVCRAYQAPLGSSSSGSNMCGCVHRLLPACYSPLTLTNPTPLLQHL